MKCPQCNEWVRDGLDECQSCCAPLYRKDRGRQVESLAIAQDQQLRTATLEARRFGLPGRMATESVREFINRVDRDKTPVMLERWKTQGRKI